MNLYFVYTNNESALAISMAIEMYEKFAVDNNLEINNIDFIYINMNSDEPDDHFSEIFLDIDLVTSDDYYCIMDYRFINESDKEAFNTILKNGAHVRCYNGARCEYNREDFDFIFNTLEAGRGHNYQLIVHTCISKSLATLIYEDFCKINNIKADDEIIRKYESVNKLIK